MTQRMVLVKCQIKDQVWYEAVSLQEYRDLQSKSNKQWEQTHALQEGTKREISLSREKQLHPQETA